MRELGLEILGKLVQSPRRRRDRGNVFINRTIKVRMAVSPFVRIGRRRLHRLATMRNDEHQDAGTCMCELPRGIRLQSEEKVKESKIPWSTRDDALVTKWGTYVGKQRWRRNRVILLGRKHQGPGHFSQRQDYTCQIVILRACGSPSYCSSP
jgi:hypothetical protein